MEPHFERRESRMLIKRSGHIIDMALQFRELVGSYMLRREPSANRHQYTPRFEKLVERDPIKLQQRSERACVPHVVWTLHGGAAPAAGPGSYQPLRFEQPQPLAHSGPR